MSHPERAASPLQRRAVGTRRPSHSLLPQLVTPLVVSTPHLPSGTICCRDLPFVVLEITQEEERKVTPFTIMAFQTRSQRKYAAASKVEQLPVELLTKVLEFSELPERLRVARCNKTLLNRVTKECTELWVKIDFHRCHSYSQNLTDYMLSSLLTRVNALNITTCLNLTNCTKIVGSGLRPLRNSQVLESIDLRTSFRYGRIVLNQALVMKILETMFPYSLFQVRFWRVIRGTARREISRSRALIAKQDAFYNRLCAAKHEQSLQQQTRCSSCQHLVAEETGLSQWTRCTKCKEQFCRSNSCSASVQATCHQCQSISCETCNDVGRCDECDEHFCKGCKEVSDPCRVCMRTFCAGQGDVCPLVLTCNDCGESICEQCDDRSVSRTLLCVHCLECYCGRDECRMVESCDVCLNPLCQKCCEMVTCIACDVTCCQRCYK